MTIRIVLVDDHEIMREGLKAILERESDLKVVGEAADGRTAVSEVLRHAPDVVIMDVGVPRLNGVEATRQIVAARPQVKVIALSMHEEKRFVSGMFRAGASADLLKLSAARELAQALREVIDGNLYVSPKVAGVLFGDYLQHVADTSGTKTKTSSAHVSAKYSSSSSRAAPQPRSPRR